MELSKLDDKPFIETVAKRLLRIKAISPESGGSGESEKADEIIKILDELGYGYKRYDIIDNKNVKRSNITVKIGNFEKTLWIISHIDTVPEGDVNLWNYNPFEATVIDNKIYGRGSADNGQSIFMDLLLLKTLDKSRLKINLGIAFVSDEETGNNYGIRYLLDKNVFNNDDLIIVPDAGSQDGLMIETAEKSILQLKFTVKGSQGHASMPEYSVNAFRDSSKFVDMLDFNLHEKYYGKNNLFIPPYSTFEPTKHEKNIDNINTIPGTDIFYLDCRVLPEYNLGEIKNHINDLINKFELTNKSKISYEVMDEINSPQPTDDNSSVIKKLKLAIRNIRGKDAVTVGIGGETFASFFRERNIPAAVWSTTVIESAHMPDEYCLITDILDDLKIFEYIIYN